MDALRPAASIEGLLVFAVLWLILGALGKAKKGSTARPPPPKPSGPGPDPGQERFSLQQVLKEIERVKREQQAQAMSGRATQQLPPPRTRVEPRPRSPVPVRVVRPSRSVTEVERGPLGRTTAVRLPSAQEAPPVDLDAEAEEVAQRRVEEAEARNRALSDADYRSFHQRVLAEDRAAAVVKPRPSPTRFRGAIVWREILGPPKALEEWDRW